MSAATISINKKLADGTLISVGGTSYDDFYQNILGVLNDSHAAAAVLEEVSQALVSPAATGFAEAGANVARSFPQATPATPSPVRIVPDEPAGDTPPVCAHGMARTYKSGTSAGGKAWKAWMCVLPKGQSCEPTWIR
jgi:hypothetical protein